MTSESMFVEQKEPKVVIKEEPPSSTFDSEDRLDRSTPMPMQSTDTPVTPLSRDTEDDRNSRIPSTPADHRTEKEQMKLRLAHKSREIEAAKDWLGGFPDWLHPKERNIPEVGDWIEDIEAILKHGKLPRVVLGFMGPSGCGKSSVINALLDEESLLPCNCTEACTAVAVEVAWNPINDRNRAYRAKIQFVTAVEWKAELDLLVAELMSLEPDARLNPGGDEAKVAAAKIKAVYPDLAIDKLTEESASELMNDIVISKWLGKNVDIEMAAGRGKRFAAEICQYIDSSPRLTRSGGRPRRATPYWPLVKVVQIFARSPVLSTGLVLVDLPGSGDSNAARAMVAQDYMQQVSAICIVADIKRALTSSVARNLFGRGTALKRRLLRDGLLDDEHTFFVLTCTDIINNQQVIGKQGLDDLPEAFHILREQQNNQRRLRVLLERHRNLETKLKQSIPASNALQKTIRAAQAAGVQPNQPVTKRRRVDGDAESQVPDTTPSLVNCQHELAQRELFQENCSNSISKLVQEGKNINFELANMEKRLSAICIRERNSYVTLRMKEDFSLGMRELEEELRDEGDDEAGRISQLSQESIRDGIDTFCVCSKAYQKLCGRFPLEQMPAGFDIVEDTSMPQLMKHCLEYTLNARERLADVFLEDLTRLRKRMRAWADNTTPDREVTSRQRRLLQESSVNHLKLLDQTVSDSIDSAAAQLQDDLHSLSQRAFKYAVPTAAMKAPETFDKWIQSVHNVRTWKAICKKEGIHVSKARGETTEYNWNDDLAEELTRLLDRNLGRIASQVLPELQNDYTAKIQESLKNFTASINTSSMAVTKHISNSLQNLMCNLDRLRAEALREVNVKFALALTMSRVIDRKVPPTVRLAMKPGYIKANAISGTGSFQKSKTVIGNHIEKICRGMYTDAATEVAQGVEDIITLLKSNLKKDLHNNIEKVKEDFEKMLVIACATPRPESGPAKIELQEEVLIKLGRFDSLLGEFRSSDGKLVELKDLIDLTDPKRDEDDDIKDGSEDDLGEDGINMAGYQDEFDGLFGTDNMDFEYKGLDNPDANADEAFDEENVNESYVFVEAES